MKKIITPGLLLIVSTLGLSVQAADTTIAPRTEWGQPDLQGVWNFSSNIPIQRPERYANRFTAIVPMTKVGGQLDGYACHEGNYGMGNILPGARQEERMAAAGNNQ